MSYEQVCDICKTNYGNKNIGAGSRIKCVHKGGLMLEVIAGIDPTWNSGHVCDTCLAAGLRDLANALETGKSPRE